jgi:hypothetical protein
MSKTNFNGRQILHLEECIFKELSLKLQYSCADKRYVEFPIR